MIEPYWTSKDGRHVVYCGDCMDVLLSLERIDAILTDPPYGHAEKWTGGTWFTKNVYETDKVLWDNKIVDLSQILSCDSEKIIWGGNYYALPPSRCWLAWVKRDNMPTMADFELAWTNFDRPSKEFYAKRNGWDRVHPTEKPVALMEWCLGFLTGETILDPFMGSGTTGVACVRLNRRFIGIEISKEYCDIAVERIKRELSQPRLELEPQPIFEQTKLFDETK